MHPIIFKAGPFILYSFSLFLAVGLVLGSFVVWKFGREENSEDKLFDAVLVSFVSALTAARLFFIASHFDFFGFDLIKWILFSHYPGFSFWGGFAGALAGLMFFLRSRLAFLKFLDLFSLAFSLTVIFGDFGCFLGGCTVGKTAFLPWAMVLAGVEGRRHPVSLYSLLADVVIVLLVYRAFGYLRERRRNLGFYEGLLSLFYFSLFFISRAFIEFYKEKNLYVRSIPVFALALLVLGILGLVIFYKKIGRSFRDDFGKIYGKIRYIKEEWHGPVFNKEN